MGRLIPFVLLFSNTAFANDGDSHKIPAHLFSFLVVLLLAKCAVDLTERWGQPGVLGELLMGAFLGNLAYLSFGAIQFFEPLKGEEFVRIFAEIGAIILLFEVGLQTNISEMKKIGLPAMTVATLGVILPVAMGYLVSSTFHFAPDGKANLFLGATLAATSVGITARILQDLGKLQQTESKIILGAAVFDDVLGLILLAIVSGIVKAGSISFLSVLIIIAKALLFFVVAIALGSLLTKQINRVAKRIKAQGMMLMIALTFAFFFAYLADLFGLAPIVGAFSAGLVLDETHFQGFNSSLPLEKMLQPLTQLFVPAFFVLMGMLIKIETFFNPSIYFVTLALTSVAIVGKIAAGWGAKIQKGTSLDYLSIGIGMIPRGEVGLIFVGIGVALGVVSDFLYSAVIIMIVLTTFMTPLLLKWAFQRRR